MKLWLSKLKISNALDGATPISEPASRAKPTELGRFAEMMRSLDAQLKAASPRAVAPATLHQDIMRSVRAAAASPAPARQVNLWRWLPAPALAALLAALGLWFWQRPAPDVARLAESHSAQLLAAAVVTLDMTHDLTHNAPTAALAPLAQEMEFLRSDLQRTAQFLLASVP